MNPRTDRSFFGHPRGLSNLFFTEMWERFGYYGMRALLILFLTASPASGGFGYSVAQAAAIYGLYTAMAYLSSVPGGWIADRFLGQRRAVMIGGLIISVGYWMLAASAPTIFFAGLVVVVIGTGLLKPNISTIVGQLYETDDMRRDSGFSIFYMGVNLGGLLGPLFCGYVGQRINWHWGFSLAGFGMAAGVLQYWFGQRHLGEAGVDPVKPANEAEAKRQRLWLLLVGLFCALAVVVMVTVSLQTLVNVTGLMLSVVVAAIFAWLLFGAGWTTTERKRFGVVFVLFLASCLFWAAFEQAGSSLNLFAQNSTDNRILGWEFPSTFFQSLNSFYIITLSGVFAWLWLWLGDRQPSSPTKFAWALVLAGLGYVVLIGPAQAASGGIKASPWWLVLTYLLHTVGELCLSPVGLSAMTKLAPARVAGLIMGVWFMSISIGNYLGARLTSFYGEMPIPTLFTLVAFFAIGAGLILAVAARPVSRMMGNIR